MGVSLNCVQWIQNLLARITCNKFYHINSHSIDIVRSLKLQTMPERQDYFLCVLIFKCMPGLAPHYVSNEVTMHVDIHEYYTKITENINTYIYMPRSPKEMYKKNILYEISSLCNKLPPSPLINLHFDWIQAQPPTFKWLNTPGSYSSFYMHAYTAPNLNAFISCHICLQLIWFIHTQNFSKF